MIAAQFVQGKAGELKPGAGTLTFKVKLPRSIYVLSVIARVAEADPAKNQGLPEWPMFGQVKVTGPGDEVTPSRPTWSWPGRPMAHINWSLPYPPPSRCRTEKH